MSAFEEMFGDYLNAYKNTSQYKDDSMLDIALRKPEFEKNLDEMWAIYSRGCTQQIIEYNKGVEQIKSAGFKVYRNSAGKHKIDDANYELIENIIEDMTVFNEGSILKERLLQQSSWSLMKIYICTEF